MRGGLGDDDYTVDDAGDLIFEADSEGDDSLFASLSFVLAGGISIEHSATTDAAGTTAIDLNGNEFGQTINGNAGSTC